MNDLQAFKKAIKMQREFSRLYDENPIVSLNPTSVHLELGFFNTLVNQGVIFNVKKKRDNHNQVIHLTGQVDSGDEVVGVDKNGYKEKARKNNE